MKKESYFAELPNDSWPSLEQIRPYFLATPGREWFFTGGVDSAVLIGIGKDDTERLPVRGGRIDVRLYMLGKPGIGVSLTYDLWDGRHHEKSQWISKGDMSHHGRMVTTLEGDQYPECFFIPFVEAWNAAKEFVETEGELPKTIEWFASRDLPPNTFPDT